MGQWACAEAGGGGGREGEEASPKGVCWRRERRRGGAVSRLRDSLFGLDPTAAKSRAPCALSIHVRDQICHHSARPFCPFRLARVH